MLATTPMGSLPPIPTTWLIFDQRKGRKPLAERTRASTAITASGRHVTVLRA